MSVGRGLVITVSMLLVLAGALPAPAGPLDGVTSSNVEFIRTVPMTSAGLPGASGARLVGNYLYVRGVDTFEIFDVSEPTEPKQVGAFTPIPPSFEFEDPDTNGEILLFGTNEEGSLYPYKDLLVIDVSNPEEPEVIATVEGEGAHTYTCVLNCRWAYASNNGHIIDLRDPSNPKVLSERWNDSLRVFNPPNYSEYAAHDLTEIAPGLLLTASTPMFLLDARRDPSHPRVLARSDGSPYSFGGTAWPRGGKDRFVLSWSEALQSPRCELRDVGRGTALDSAFKTWDARHWKENGLFIGIDEYYITNGTHLDGEPVYSGGPPGAAGCSASWFDVHPDFHNGGLLAAATTGHGTKFLKVTPTGSLELVGFFLPHAGNAVAAYWITDEIVYTTDAHRGIDILRFTGDL